MRGDGATTRARNSSTAADRETPSQRSAVPVELPARRNATMSLSRSRTVSGALLLVGALVMTACSNGDQTSSSGGGGGNGKVTSVGVMLQDISNPFFASMQKSLQDAGKKQGFKVNVQDGRQDLGT